MTEFCRQPRAACMQSMQMHGQPAKCAAGTPVLDGTKGRTVSDASRMAAAASDGSASFFQVRTVFITHL